MTDFDSQEERVKNFLKEQVRNNLLKIGRRLVVEQGAEFLTARKLSDASSISVGSIYNQFANMDNFIRAQNMQTLDELFKAMQVIIPADNPYVTLNCYADIFSNFVINNPNLWKLLFDAHLKADKGGLPFKYVRKIKRIEKLLETQLSLMFGRLRYVERRLAGQVLTMTLFALSGLVATSTWEGLRQVNKNNICKLLLNTYIAGLNSLQKG